MVNQEEILRYAREYKQKHPTVTSSELRILLEEEFNRTSGGYYSSDSRGLIANPVDVISGIWGLIESVIMWRLGDKEGAISKMIDAVITILF